MARVFYDLVARGPEYQDREGKKKYENDPCGILAVEDDGRMWITLKFLGQRVRISVFEQRERDGNPRNGGNSGGSGRQVSSSPDDRRPAGHDVPEDDIPF